jgi:hypothetical protein
MNQGKSDRQARRGQRAQARRSELRDVSFETALLLGSNKAAYWLDPSNATAPATQAPLVRGQRRLENELALQCRRMDS